MQASLFLIAAIIGTGLCSTYRRPSSASGGPTLSRSSSGSRSGSSSGSSSGSRSGSSSPSSDSFSGSISGSSGSHPSGPGYPAVYHPPSKDNRVDDELDLYFARADAAKDKQNTQREQLGALEARQALQKSVFDVLMILGDLQDTDSHQMDRINLLEATLYDLENFVDNELGSSATKVTQQNQDNIYANTGNLKRFAYEQEVDIKQTIETSDLTTLSQSVVSFVNQAVDNAVAVFNAGLAVVTRLVISLEVKEKRRVCEVGEVTLTNGDARAEYPLQNVYESTPQLLYSVAGFDLGLNQNTKVGSYQANPYAYAPPEALGFRINGYFSEDTVVIEANGLLSFGERQVEAVTVTFQACSIGPGLGPIKH